MIRFISRAVAEWLLKHGAISVNEKELYEYSIYSFLFTLTPLFLVLMVSIPLNMAVEGILLITPFIFLRKFAGGFHFQTPLPCIIVSTLVLLGCLLENRIILEYPTLQDYIRTVVIPDMQVKLRQGFGRAIRTETDTCVVSILDYRAAPGERYHRAVLDALPDLRITGKIEDVEEFIRAKKGPDYFMP